MYKINNKVYADAGYYLKRGSSIAYAMEDNGDEIQEIEADIEDMQVLDSIILWSNNNLAQLRFNNGTYADYKKAIIQKKYNNDDQIAIILNKDSGDETDIIAYIKMQEWRDWASQVAHKILTLITK
jgi:hypothetical protein